MSMHESTAVRNHNKDDNLATVAAPADTLIHMRDFEITHLSTARYLFEIGMTPSQRVSPAPRLNFNITTIVMFYVWGDLVMLHNDRLLMSLADIAERYELAVATVRTYSGQAAQRRRAGTSRPHDFPAAAARVGNSPLFDSAQVDDWHTHRPGRGVGGGRPRTVNNGTTARDSAGASESPSRYRASDAGADPGRTAPHGHGATIAPPSP